MFGDVAMKLLDDSYLLPFVDAIRGRAARAARRARELADIGAASRRRAAKRFLGRTVEIVVEKSLPISGWTGEYLWLEELRTAGGPEADVRRGSHRRKAMEFTVKDVRDGVLYGRPMRDGGRNG